MCLKCICNRYNQRLEPLDEMNMSKLTQGDSELQHVYLATVNLSQQSETEQRLQTKSKWDKGTFSPKIGRISIIWSYFGYLEKKTQKGPQCFSNYVTSQRGEGSEEGAVGDYSCLLPQRLASEKTTTTAFCRRQSLFQPESINPTTKDQCTVLFFLADRSGLLGFS